MFIAASMLLLARLGLGVAAPLVGADIRDLGIRGVRLAAGVRRVALRGLGHRSTLRRGGRGARLGLGMIGHVVFVDLIRCLSKDGPDANRRADPPRILDVVLRRHMLDTWKRALIWVVVDTSDSRIDADDLVIEAGRCVLDSRSRNPDREVLVIQTSNEGGFSVARTVGLRLLTRAGARHIRSHVSSQTSATRVLEYVSPAIRIKPCTDCLDSFVRNRRDIEVLDYLRISRPARSAFRARAPTHDRCACIRVLAIRAVSGEVRSRIGHASCYPVNSPTHFVEAVLDRHGRSSGDRSSIYARADIAVIVSCCSSASRSAIVLQSDRIDRHTA
jgi:hypothetical protein